MNANSKLIQTIILLLSFQHLIGQVDSTYLQLIEKRMRNLQTCGTLYYADRLPEEILKPDIENLKKKRLHSLKRNRTYREFQLTRAEWKEIGSQLNKVIRDSLPESLFSNSMSVSVDSIRYLVEAYNKTVRDSVVKLPTSQRPQAPCVLKWAFYFSKPIYVRDKTILFYFFMYFRNSSGNHSFYLSRKKDGLWENGIFIIGGDW